MCQSLLHTWAAISTGVEGGFPEEGPLNYGLEDKAALKEMLMAAAHVKTYGW